MTRAEAEERARQLKAEAQSADYVFVARESSSGDWEVARVRVPAELRRGKLTETVDASPQPSPADDPRTGHERRAPGITAVSSTTGAGAVTIFLAQLGRMGHGSSHCRVFAKEQGQTSGAGGYGAAPLRPTRQRGSSDWSCPVLEDT